MHYNSNIQKYDQKNPIKKALHITKEFDNNNLHNSNTYIRSGNTKKIPKEIVKFTSLEHFIFNNSNIESLPPCFSTFNIISIDLSNNCIVHFPEPILKLKTLKIFILSNNKIMNLENINLSSLKTFIIKNNCIENVVNIEMENLSYLDLSYNNIKCIDNAKINNVEYFDISNNKLSNLPICLKKMKKLEYLFFSENNITEIPRNIICNNIKSINNNQKTLGLIRLPNINKLHKDFINLENCEILCIDYFPKFYKFIPRNCKTLIIRNVESLNDIIECDNIFDCIYITLSKIQYINPECI